ncbi:MAG: hypothetical protein WC724_03735 [Candidatus Paceibacterota bacterium]|jgi:hypothetical protein
MEILGKLFGNDARVKIIRLFFLNADTGFDPKEIERRTKLKTITVRRELAILKSIGFIKKKLFSKDLPPKKKTSGWFLDSDFPYKRELKDLILNADSVNNSKIVDRFKKAGTIKLLIVSGIFIKDNDSRTDVLIVGDNLKKGKIENAMRLIEAEIGKELAYAFFDTKEFKYRLEMYDKFIYDILDYPHQRLVDKLQLPEKNARF